MPEALALARRIASLPPGPVRDLRRILARRSGGGLEGAMAAETEATVRGFLDPKTAGTDRRLPVARGQRYGTRAQTAIRLALANPDISGVVVGLAELGHLEEALAAAEIGPLPDEALAELHALYERGFERA
jgi:aryl-alcohol dehydrogenase-like predicted oxidoreductase